MRFQPPFLAALAAPVLVVGALLAGCGDSESRSGYDEVRERTTPRHQVPEDLTTAQRLGFRRVPDDATHAGMGATADRPRLTWTTPEGWEELPATELRQGSWRVRGEPQTDASLTLLQGGGGSAPANVNRWREQMGLPAWPDQAVEDLPRKTMFGQPALFVEIEGTYRGGMGPDAQPIEDARMLALLLQVPQAAVFLKLTGPDEVVRRETDAFLALAASLDLGAGTAPPTGQAGGPAESGKLAWDLPKGWEARGAKPMRLVTVGPQDAPGVECYVAILSGDAGGTEANVNRWRQQMRQEPLSPEAIRALETIDMLGRKGVVVRIEGDFSGMGAADQEGAVLYGTICQRASDVVFVKMIGPKAAMEGEYEAFLAFCRSLREES